MATIHYANAVTPLHGSILGTTFSRARPTCTARQLTKQAYRHTARRNARITHPARVHALWRDTLTQQQRDDWNTLGANTNWTDAEGNPYNPTGYCLFARGNLLRQQAGYPDQPNAPGAADSPHYPITYAEANHNLTAQMFDAPAARHHVIFLLSTPSLFTRYAFTGPFIATTWTDSDDLHAGWVIIFTPANGFNDTRRHFIRDRSVYCDASATAPTLTQWDL